MILVLGHHWGWGQQLLPSSASPAQGLSLSAAVDLALRNNPLAQVAAAGIEAAAARLSDARSGRLPSLQFSETFANSNNPVYVFGALLEQARFGPQNFSLDSLNHPGSLANFRTSINLRLPLFDRLETAVKIKQARLGEQQAASQRELIEQQIRFAVVQAYYGILVSEAKKQVADEAAHLAETEVGRIRDLFEHGAAVASDLLSMEVQLAEFRQQQIQAQGEVIIAYAALNSAVGLPIQTAQAVAGQLTDRSFNFASQEELIQLALQHRLDYRQSSIEVQLREQSVRATKGQYLPQLDVYASFGRSARDLARGSSDFAFGASLTIELLDFGRSARVRQTRAERESMDAQRRRKADEIRLEVVRASQYYLAARERLRVAAVAVDQAAETLRITQDRHEEGLTLITELLRAQTAVVRAQMNLLGARYDYYVGYAQTLLVSGQLRDVASFN